MIKTLHVHTLVTISFIAVAIAACSKGGSDTPDNPDPCANKTIGVTAATTPSDACAGTGTITVTATGSNGFTYSIDGTNFGASNTFSAKTAGTYTVTVKDGAGCTKTAQATIAATAAGAKFAEVRTLVQAKCQGCHNNTAQSGGRNLQGDCNIVSAAARIKVRAVDEGTMPQGGTLTQAEKDKITAWINAGGKFTD